MKAYSILLFVLLFFLHLPFLSSDPDHNVSFSRDAFTDEGLYTSQVRNFLITDSFNIEESDASVKTPLFSLFMLLVFKLGGIHLETARVAVLLFSLLIIGFVFRKDLMLSLLMTGITLLQYTIFQYNHFALAEFLVVASLLAAWYFMSKDSGNESGLRNIFMSCLFVALAMYLKFQYLYMVVWPLLFYFLVFIFSLISQNGNLKSVFRQALIVLCFTMMFIGIFYIAWYVPNREIFDYVIGHQTGVVFGEGEWFMKMIDYNFRNFFFNDTASAFTWLFVASLLLSPYLLFTQRNDKGFMLRLLAALSWCLLELHKPALAYLPARYLVSTFFAMGLFSSLVIAGMLKKLPSISTKIVFIVVMLSWPLTANFSAYFSVHKNRSFVLSEMNDFIFRHHTKGCTIAGAWAPALSWRVASPAVPVWKNYFNDSQTMETLRPCIIVSEVNEEDSGGAWSSQGVNPDQLSKATEEFKIRNWHVKIYVLKNEIHNIPLQP